jgi:transglutaminase-like putative cysteine protease
MTGHLESSDIIDWQTPSVLNLARALSGVNDIETARSCFLFVRDEVPHCCDLSTTAIPLKASDVLTGRTGFCYAKSHLLSALLRANGIPAGLGYVRLAESRAAHGFALHAFNWVLLNGYDWFRVDARGNNGKVSTVFNPPGESLAYYLEKEGEFFLKENFASPLDSVIAAYRKATNFEGLLGALPDAIR